MGHPSPPPSLATLRFGQASDGGSEGMAQPDPMIEFAELDAHNFINTAGQAKHAQIANGQNPHRSTSVAPTGKAIAVSEIRLPAFRRQKSHSTTTIGRIACCDG